MVNNFDQLKQIADLVAAQFGSAAEVVIHDFTGELDHTIVYIVNGHVTGRTIGDAPTQSFLKYMNVNHPRKSIEKVPTFQTGGLFVLQPPTFLMRTAH